MRRILRRKRKGYILFSAILIAFVLLIAFGTTITTVNSLLSMSKSEDYYTQLKMTAETAVFTSIAAKSNQSGTFPDSTYPYSTVYDEPNHTVTATVSHVSNGQTINYKIEAKFFIWEDGKPYIYQWRRVQ